MGRREGSPMIIWDSLDDPPVGEGWVVTWTGRTSREGRQSILDYVEDNRARLRSRYLAWVHEAGAFVVEGRSLKEHLDFGDGMSHWWLTKIVEKSPHRSPLADVLRIVAVEDIVVETRPGSVRLVSADPRLDWAFRGMCERLGISFFWDEIPGKESESPAGAGAGDALGLVAAIRGLLRHLRVGWRRALDPRPDWHGGARAVFLCGYFANVDAEEGSRGRFRSAYWGPLHDLLERLDFRVNWLHHNAHVGPGQVGGWLRGFAEKSGDREAHGFLDANLSLRVLLRTVARYVRLEVVRMRLGRLDEAFRPSGGAVSLWPILEKDWQQSLSGPLAMANCLAVELFDEALRRLPHQAVGLYLHEGNAWERALAWAWQRHGHGRLIGVVHSTVAFWDLRHFSDSRDLVRTGVSPMPRPQAVALNGPPAQEAYLSAGFPPDEALACEALRYLHLLADDGVGAAPRDRVGGTRRVLAITDFMSSFTEGMLRLLEAAAPRLPKGVPLAVKPHPVCPVRVEDYPGMRIEVLSRPLGELVREYDVAYAGSTTSGAVDAFQAGLPVVVMLGEGQLNLSPLSGCHGVTFVGNSDELATALLDALPEDEQVRETAARVPYFHLDRDLRRWQRVLSQADGQFDSTPDVWQR